MAERQDMTSGRSRRWLRIVRGMTLPALLVGGAFLYLQHGDQADASRPALTKAATFPIPDAQPWRSAIDYDALDGRLRLLMTHREMTGLAIAVVEDGKLAFVRGYGVTSRETGQPVTEHTVFRWASLSKGVAATLAAKLAEEGKLDLNRAVESYGTSLRLPDGAERLVSVSDILSHRLGLAKNSYDGRLEDGGDPVEIRHELASVQTVCPPGTCHSYQNIAYDTVAEIIGKVTGDSYADEARARLFQPLGMAGTSIGLANLTCASSWARPYRNGYPVKLTDAYYRVPAAAGVNSNIVDMARWMEAQMGEAPKVLPPALLKGIHDPRVKTFAPYGRTAIGRALHDASYGLGWRSFTYAGHRMVGHSGAVAGYRSTMMFDPETRTGIAMLWNSESSKPFRAQLELFDLYYGLPATNWMELDEQPVVPLEVAANGALRTASISAR
ncbi:serine hydrolase domain-containing protein [Rhizorhapis sp. SPR117]|uniref:serine hydrolase domain-containing protein n=1 Tax=Rhizorhapis sp. SPR117 TaxID=2912611 RepID=UPI001F31AB6A|nr:beta-lactamase family protein [Rhizorhapis sp. SPR117]